MADPSTATIPITTDPENIQLYKAARMLQELADFIPFTYEQKARVDDPKNALRYKFLLSLRAYLTWLNSQISAAALPREVEGKYRFTEDGKMQLWNPDELGYRELLVRGVGDDVHFELGDLDTDL